MNKRNMEHEHEPIVKEEKLNEDHKEFWEELNRLAEDDEVAQVEDLLIHRDFPYKRLPGEKELFVWLEGRATNKLGRKLQVELNEEGIIVPIKSE